MATTKTPKGEWSSETISEWEQSPTTTWKAQVSKSPDGKFMVGVRQYLKTKTYEGPGKGGITFQVDGNADESLEQLQNMFRDLRVHLNAPTIQVKPKVQKPAVTTVKATAPSAQYFLIKDNGKYAASVSAESVKVTSDQNKAQLFTKKIARELLDTRMSDAWDMELHVPE